MQVEIVTKPALSADLLEYLLPPAKFQQLCAIFTLGQQLLDEAESALLRGAANEWTSQELEQYVSYGLPEPPVSPQLGRLGELLRAAMVRPKPTEGESRAQ